MRIQPVVADVNGSSLPRHLESGANKHLGHPIVMGQAGAGEGADFPVEVLLHAPNLGIRIVQQQIGGAPVAVIRPTLPLLATVNLACAFARSG